MQPLPSRSVAASRLAASLRPAVALALLGALPAAAQDSKKDPREQPPLDRAAIEAGRDAGGSAYLREKDTKQGRFGLASTAPAFDPATGARLSGALTATESGFRSAQGGLVVDIARSTEGGGSTITFADGAVIRVSAAARLFGAAEQGGSFDLVARPVTGAPGDDGAVRYAGALEQADLVHAVRPGGLATELWIPALLEPLANGEGYQTIWFEEVIDLPFGWSIAGVETGATVRTRVGLPIVDDQGRARARLEAPLVYEARTAKDVPGHFARAFAELHAGPGGIVTYRVGVPAAWLADPARSYPIVIDPLITESAPVVLTNDAVVDIVARTSWWNAVAVSSASGDWDLTWGSVLAWEFPPACDFVVANGNRGSITPQTGDANLFAATNIAGTVEHAGIDNIDVGDDVDVTWPAGHVVHLLEVFVPTTGNQTLTVNAPAGFHVSLFAPGSTSAWKERADATVEFAAGATAQTVNFTETGFWALVISRDGGPATAQTTVTVRWGSAQPTFNLAATSLTLDAATYPVTLQAGGTFTFTRNITRTGTQPAGTQIDYGVYLSADSTIDPATDFEAWSFQDAGTGVLTLTGFVPSNIPSGTYFVGMHVTPVAGESSTTDNRTHDAATNHRVVVQAPPAPTPTLAVVAGQNNAVTATPTNLTVTPNQGVWNVVGLAGDNWDLTLGGATSNQAGAAIDFVAANGNLGSIASPATGSVTRVSGTGNATVFQTASTLIGATGSRTFSWTAGRFVQIFAREITATGDYTIDVTGLAGLSWALYAPGTDATWRARASAFSTGASATPKTVTINQAGWWGLVVVKDGAASAAATIDVKFQPVPPPAPTYNLAVSAAAVPGTAPIQKAVGDPITIDRTIAVTGTLPQGTSIDYSIVLSADQVVDSGDIVLHRFTGASQGAASITETIPQGTAAATYFVGVAIDAVPGETSATDNVRFASQQVVVTQAPPPPAYNRAALACNLQSNTHSTVHQAQAGDTLVVDVDVQETGTPPPSATLDYSLVLSTDQVIDANDPVIHRAAAAAAGQTRLNAVIPQSVAQGTYFLALAIDAVQSESSATDNVRFAALQVQVLPPITTGFNVIAASAQAVGAPRSVTLGDSFDVDLDIQVTSAPAQSTNVTFKVYLSNNNVISTLDHEVFSGSGTAGQRRVTCTLPASSTIQNGPHFVGVIVDALPNESTTLDNDIASLAADIDVTGVVPPPAGITLVVGQPQTIPPANDTFAFTPAQGKWNAIGVVANDPLDDFDIHVGFASSIRFNPDADFVAANGHAGTILDTTGDIQHFGALDDATLIHVQATAVTVGQPGQLAWAQGQGIALAEVAIATAGPQFVAFQGPAGLKVAIFEPGTSPDFFERDMATQELDLQPVPQQVDFNAVGVWGLVFFADAGVNPPAGTITIGWTGAPAQGFDLAAVQVSIPTGLRLAPGQSFDATRLIANLGTQASPGYVYAYYLSADNVIDPAKDVKMFESTAQAALAASGTSPATETLTLPARLTNGTYFVGLHVPQLAQDAVTANASVVAAEQLTILGGTAPGTIVRSGSSGGGGGCAVDPEGDAGAGGLLLVLLAAGLAVVRGRRPTTSVL